MSELYDFDSEYAETFTEECKSCGFVHEVSTQEDRNPEYYTEIYIKCRCGDSIPFLLPVN